VSKRLDEMNEFALGQLLKPRWFNRGPHWESLFVYWNMVIFSLYYSKNVNKKAFRHNSRIDELDCECEALMRCCVTMRCSETDSI
jgi:hypothetical protein